jgi:hypothetical protein
MCGCDGEGRLSAATTFWLLHFGTLPVWGANHRLIGQTETKHTRPKLLVFQKSADHLLII